MPSTTDASAAFSSGTRMPRFPMRRISSTIGRMPRTRRTSPESASSPASAYSESSGAFTLFVAARSVTAIGRS